MRNTFRYTMIYSSFPFAGLRILFFVLVANEPDSQLKEHSNRSHRLGAMVLSATWFKFNWAWKFSTCCLNSPPRAYHFYHSPPERHFLTSRTISVFNVPYTKLIPNNERLSSFFSACQNDETNYRLSYVVIFFI